MNNEYSFKKRPVFTSIHIGMNVAKDRDKLLLLVFIMRYRETLNSLPYGLRTPLQVAYLGFFNHVEEEKLQDTSSPTTASYKLILI